MWSPTPSPPPHIDNSFFSVYDHGILGSATYNDYYLQKALGFWIEGPSGTLIFTSGQPVILQPGTYQALGDLVLGFGTSSSSPMPPSDSGGTELMGAIISGSADFYLDVLTPGASLISESGHDYSSAPDAPEPSSLSLLVTGFFGAGILPRNKQAPDIV